MKDQTDSRTVDMFPAKRGRGRPKSGHAQSNADRQRAYRQRKAAVLVESQSLPSVSEVLAASELDELRAQLAEARKEADFLRAELAEVRKEAERVRQDSKNRNVTKIQPAYFDDLVLLLAQYCSADGSASQFPVMGTASIQEILDSWSRLHAAVYALMEPKKRNVTKNKG
jgi:hypothetical protein